MSPRRALLLASAIAASQPRAGLAQELPAALAAPVAEPDISGLFSIERNLPAIAQVLAQAPDVFDAQLAAAILGDLAALPAAKAVLHEAGPGHRLGQLPSFPADGRSGTGLAALGHASLAGPVSLDWSQRLDGAALAGKLAVNRAGGPVEVRFDLESRVPIEAPATMTVRYDSAAFVRVLPGLKLGAATSGTIDAKSLRTSDRAIGPEAKLSIPGLGGTLDAEAGWQMPVREDNGPAGPQPGVVKWGLSFRRPL
jgi:hypothetical protein